MDNIMATQLLAQIFIVIILLITIILFLFENIDKTKIAFVGSLLAMLIFLFLIFQKNEAFKDENFLEFTSHFVNIEAIIVIFSIGVIVVLTKKAGFFDLVSLYLVKLTKGNQRKLFIVLGIMTFFISMFFDNLSAIILLGSLTIIVCKEVEVNPIPFVLFVGVNTVLGGIPTPVSSIPNIIYYSEYSEINFIEFMGFMLPISILFFLITTGYFFIIFRKDLFKIISDEKKEQIMRINPWSGIEDKKDIRKAVILLSLLFGGFLLTSIPANPLDVAFVALIVAIIGTYIFREKLKEIVEEGIEWQMIVFFICLFVLMGVLNASGALQPLTNLFKSILGNDITPLNETFVALIIGSVGFIVIGVITVVPSAVIFAQIFHSLEVSSVGLWLSFVLTGNIAGSLLPISSATILMALEILKTEKIKFNFKSYFKYLLPITLLLQIMSIAYSILIIFMF
jgi:Na+/H+ antiporter NhaD/arsenite permease-like protein